MSLLCGMLDTDGEINHHGSITYSTTSKRLADDVIWLARSLGCKAMLQPTAKQGWYPDKQGEHVICRDCYRVTINAPFNPFTLKHRKDRYKPSEERYLKRWIDSIEPIDNADGMCITVDNPDGLYLTNDFIVTHNSALIAWIVNWAMDTRENTRGIVTANTDNQLRTKTWPEVQKWSRLRITHDWTDVTATSIMSTSANPTNWKIDAIPWSRENPESFAGLHNNGNRILVLMDEASAIDDKIWEVSEGAMTDSNTQIIWLAFGNPTRNTGRFRECWRKMRNLWHTWEIDARNAIMGNQALFKQWIDTYGIDSDFVKVRVRGMFPSTSARQLISTDDVDKAYGANLRIEQYSFAPVIITCDPAWEGDDELVIAKRQGLAFFILRVIPKNDNDIQIASIIANIEDSERADSVIIDAGYGTGIISAGKTMGRSWHGVWFSGKSPDDGCLNMRAYMWVQMRDWLKSGGVIPADQGLYDDLIGPEVSPRIDGKIQLESKVDMKKRGLPSPNKGDSLALSFAIPVYKQSRQSGLEIVDGMTFGKTKFNPIKRR